MLHASRRWLHEETLKRFLLPRVSSRFLSSNHLRESFLPFPRFPPREANASYASPMIILITDHRRLTCPRLSGSPMARDVSFFRPRRHSSLIVHDYPRSDRSFAEIENIFFSILYKRACAMLLFLYLAIILSHIFSNFFRFYIRYICN